MYLAQRTAIAIMRKLHSTTSVLRVLDLLLVRWDFRSQEHKTSFIPLDVGLG